MGVSKNSTVAIYGKGGAGKSFLTSMVAKTLPNATSASCKWAAIPSTTAS